MDEKALRGVAPHTAADRLLYVAFAVFGGGARACRSHY